MAGNSLIFQSLYETVLAVDFFELYVFSKSVFNV